MSTWNSLVQNYIVKYSNQVQKVTVPLRTRFDIEYFTYHRINNSGQYTVLVDRPDWAEHYVTEKIFLNDPYLRHPSVYQEGMCLIKSHGSVEYKAQIKKGAKQVLNMNLGVIIIQKDEEGVEFYGFSSPSRQFENLYLNTPQVFSSFATYFKNSLKGILSQMTKEAYSLAHLKGDDYHHAQVISPQMGSENLLNFYKDLGMGKELEKARKLSKREVECLKLLLEDKLAKEIATTLKLSVRTVESYFENIKNKLDCPYKSDVLKMAKLFQSMGLLPYSLR